jgi:UDP-N-acetylmuramate--alanine ligase
VAKDVQRTTEGSAFNVYFRGEALGHFAVPTFGKHNVLNALAVVAVAHQGGMDLSKVATYMQTFRGVKRRFSEKHVGDTVIIDDFAHHPTEIEATLDAARQKHPDREIVAVFQPHTFTRTIALLDEFAEALNQADSVYLAQIYGSAREKDNGDVKIEDLKAKITRPGAILTVDNVSPLLDHDNAVYVFMGAGNIQQYEYSFEQLLSQLTENKQ